jgi:predicted RNA-binding Zn-ribbon protein involved in translation (DUF1610 family)
LKEITEMANRRTKRSWINRYSSDILLMVVFILGYVIVINHNYLIWQIRVAIWNVGQFITGLMKTTTDTASTNKTVLVVFGWTILSLAVVYWRVMVHVSQSQLWRVDNCPRCQHDQFKRMHRTIIDRIINKITRLHLRRYRCSNCGWTGLARRQDQNHLEAEELFESGPITPGG